MAREQDHQNIATFEWSGTTFAPHDPARVRARIEAIVAGLVGVNRRGGTLYIPRVADGQLWVVGSGRRGRRGTPG
jgi:hypothetical protein